MIWSSNEHIGGHEGAAVVRAMAMVWVSEDFKLSVLYVMAS